MMVVDLGDDVMDVRNDPPMPPMPRRGSMFGPSLDYVYDTPDGNEHDADILRGEAMFFNTPLASKYSPIVYESLKEVQGTCEADFTRLCRYMVGVHLSLSPSSHLSIYPSIPLSLYPSLPLTSLSPSLPLYF
jgi:hypothetical protein